MRRNSTNYVYVLGAKHQLGDLRPQIEMLAENWGDSDIVDLKNKDGFRDNCEGLMNGSFAFVLHCVKGGEIEVIANVKFQGLNIKTITFEEKERNISLVKFRSLEQCLEYLAKFEETAEFLGDCLYGELGEPNCTMP